MNEALRLAIEAAKLYVRAYLEWREVGADKNGKVITPEVTARYEKMCKFLKDMGETYP